MRIAYLNFGEAIFNDDLNSNLLGSFVFLLVCLALLVFVVHLKVKRKIGWVSTVIYLVAIPFAFVVSMFRIGM